MDKKFETKKKKSLSIFVKEHKKEITIGALTIGTIVTGIVIYKKCNVPLKRVTAYSDAVHLGAEIANERLPNSLLNVDAIKNGGNDNISDYKTINVPDYIRKLPKDYKHSQNAVESAKKLGYNLLDDETFVQKYSYSKMSA